MSNYTIETRPALEKILTAKRVKEKDAVLHIQRQFYILLRVLSSDRPIKVEMFDKNTMELYVFILKTSPWVHISPSVHGWMGHGGEMIRRNENRGLEKLSEQGSECN